MSEIYEGVVRGMVKDYLQLRGWYVWPTHKHDGAHRAAVAGLSDFEAVKAGQFIAVEVKTEKGRLRPAQEEHATKLYAKGIRFITCRCVEDLQKEGI